MCASVGSFEDRLQARVSIVVPSYNYHNLTVYLIKSVLNQTFADWELIIVDDCSTDNTPSLLERFCEIDQRIRIIFKRINEGMVNALNDGFRQAHGELIIGMNADDCLTEPTALAKLVKFLDEHPDVGLVYTDNWVTDESGNKIEVFRKQTRVSDDLIKGNPIVTWSCIWRDSIFRKIGRQVEFDMCCDYDLWLKLSEHSRIAHLQEPLFGWYRHNDSLYFRNRPEGSVQELQCLLNARVRRRISGWNREGFCLAVRFKSAKAKLWLYRKLPKFYRVLFFLKYRGSLPISG